MDKQIRVTFHTNGKVEFDAEGFIGGSCQGIMDQTTKGLGMTLEDHKKPEYYLAEEVHAELLT